jgi:hypothetical protein
MLGRYVPSPVTFFHFEDNFFDNAEKFGVSSGLLFKQENEILITMKGGAGICFWGINLQASAIRSVAILTFIGEPITGGPRVVGPPVEPDNVNGAASFSLKLTDRILYSRVTLILTLNDEKRFGLTVKTAEGFVFTS